MSAFCFYDSRGFGVTSALLKCSLTDWGHEVDRENYTNINEIFIP